MFQDVELLSHVPKPVTKIAKLQLGLPYIPARNVYEHAMEANAAALVGHV
jgi:hypothetical protein